MQTKPIEKLKNSTNNDERVNYIAYAHSNTAFCGVERKNRRPYPDGNVCKDCLFKLGNRPVEINGKLVYLND